MPFDFSGKSEHFMKFVVRGEEIDFDSFETQEQLDRYLQELRDFEEETAHLADEDEED